MNGDGPASIDPRYDAAYPGEFVREQEGERQLRQRQGELATRHGYDTVRGRWRRWLSSAFLAVLAVGFVVWVALLLTNTPGEPDVAVEDEGGLVDVLAPEVAIAWAATIIGAERLLLPDNPVGERLALIKLNIVRDRLGDAAPVASTATYWTDFVHSGSEPELLIHQFAPNVAARGPSAGITTHTIGSSTVTYGTETEPALSAEAPPPTIDIEALRPSPEERSNGIRIIAALESSSIHTWYLVEGPDHPTLLISYRGDDRPLPAAMLAMIESMLEDAG